MKKLCLTVLALAITASCVFALTQEEELTKLRNAKNAQDAVINTQIKTYKSEIERITLDEKIPAAKKDAMLNEYASKVQALSDKKSAIRSKYQKDKKAIKRKYK